MNVPHKRSNFFRFIGFVNKFLLEGSIKMTPPLKFFVLLCSCAPKVFALDFEGLPGTFERSTAVTGEFVCKCKK